MKILYVGSQSCLSATITERLTKEEHQAFFLCHSDEEKKKGFFSHHQFAWSERAEDVKRVFASVTPDVVIYEGIDYQDEIWGEKQRENLNRISVVLEECVQFGTSKFVLLSSVEADNAELLKGIVTLQEERMAEVYNKNRGLDVTILRLAHIFGDEIVVGAKDWLGELAEKLVLSSELVLKEEMLQPIHVSDVADAVIRVLEGENDFLYNICSSKQIEKSKIAKLMGQKLNPEKTVTVIETDEEAAYISNQSIKEGKEWVEFWSWEKMAEEDQFVYTNNKEGDSSKSQKGSIFKNSILKSGIRKTIENIVIFAVFCLIHFFTRDHALFAQVDWLLIYVVVVSLAYGVKQGTLAVVLAGGTYLSLQGTNIFEMTNFYSYAENLLMIVEFLFFGIVVGYSCDMLREEVRKHKSELSAMADSYDKLKEINDKNVLLKNEYEKRVLDAKTSLPKLYSIINRITVLDVNRIFMEILRVIEELLQTDTVAVYRVSSDSSYLRLIASLNKESVVEGNSWNLSNYPEIEQSIRQSRIYEGDIWKNEPAIVLPIESSEGCEAVIVVKELPLEAQSLHSVNMLRTLLILVSDSINKALQYDYAVREQKYYKDTNILYPEEFRNAVNLAEEKKERELAESCIIVIQVEKDMLDTYYKAEKLFREMDIWGSDEEGGLYVLLGNTSEQDVKIVLERLKKNKIEAKKLEKIR